ncbi:MAG: hypothetical protein WKH68_10075 [Candidatus Limnocylindria bacterium]
MLERMMRPLSGLWNGAASVIGWFANGSGHTTAERAKRGIASVHGRNANLVGDRGAAIG